MCWFADEPTGNAQDIQPERAVHELDSCLSPLAVLVRLALTSGDAQHHLDFPLEHGGVDDLDARATGVTPQPCFDRGYTEFLVDLVDDMREGCDVESSPLGDTSRKEGVLDDVDKPLACSGRNSNAVVDLVDAWVPAAHPASEFVYIHETQFSSPNPLCIGCEERADASDPYGAIWIESPELSLGPENLASNRTESPIACRDFTRPTADGTVDLMASSELLFDPVLHGPAPFVFWA